MDHGLLNRLWCLGGVACYPGQEPCAVTVTEARPEDKLLRQLGLWSEEKGREPVAVAGVHFLQGGPRGRTGWLTGVA